MASRSSRPGKPGPGRPPGSARPARHPSAQGRPAPRRDEAPSAPQVHAPRRDAPRGPRDESAPGPTYVYGRNPVREALRGRRRVHAILLADGPAGEREAGIEARITEWCRRDAAGAPAGPGATGAPSVAGSAPSPGGSRAHPVPPIRHLPAAELTALLHTPDHQGIAAEVDPYPYLEAEELARTHTLLVALDGVQDPHNLGAIIRTAEGVGAGVVIPRHRAVEVTAAVVKASAGATEHAAVARVRNLADLLSLLKKEGFWIYGAAAGAASAYTAQDYTYPTCFVLGSEGEGLGRRVASLCDVMVSLPLTGRVESLNVSVSAGVLLYEALRQRRQAAEGGTSAGAGQGPGRGRGGPAGAPEGGP